MCTKFEESILIYEAMIAKNRFDLLLAVNWVKVTQLWCNSNSTCRATYWMYIPSFKLISQSMLKKSPENADGQTDGRTLPRHNTSRFSNGRINMYRDYQFGSEMNEQENAFQLAKWLHVSLLSWVFMEKCYLFNNSNQSTVNFNLIIISFLKHYVAT